MRIFYSAILFVICFYLPIENAKFNNSVFEAFALLKWYAREHVLLCLVPAFFIAGAISSFVNQSSVVKYFGAKANKFFAYTIASVSGTILTVCSCTILPIFSGIYKRGAGIGPAIAFLYSGPAISLLAIILTTKILGTEIGFARAIGSIFFSLFIGLIMNMLFSEKKKDENSFEKDKQMRVSAQENSENDKPIWQTLLFFLPMVTFLVFANLSEANENNQFFYLMYKFKWQICILSLIFLGLVISKFFKKQELKDWMLETNDYALKILPLLFFGVLLSGFLLGRVGHEGIIPSEWISRFVGTNSLFANFFSSIVGSLMYFATITEIPIVQGLMQSGMNKGPALALLLSGPALSLPNMIVINSVIGFRKTMTYVGLVVIFSTFAGFIFGNI